MEIKTLTNTADSDSLFNYLIRTRQIVPGYGEGIYTFSGLYMELMVALDTLFVNIAKKMFNANEERYPTIFPLRELNKIKYFKKFPHLASLVYQVDIHDAEIHNQISKDANAGLVDDVYFLRHPKYLRHQANYVLNPSVCYHTFLMHKDEYIDGADYAVLAVSPCHRNEFIDDNPLRLAAFTMRECVFIGDAVKIREKAQSFYEAIVKEVVLLVNQYDEHYASDMFFGNDASTLKRYQDSHKLKLEFSLPILSSDVTPKEILLSVLSRNYHQETFCRCYGIHGNSKIESACVAFGLERMAYGILSQIGFNTSSWNDCKIKTFIVN